MKVYSPLVPLAAVEMTALRGRMLPPPLLVLRLLDVLAELLRLPWGTLVAPGRALEFVVEGLLPLGAAEPLGRLLGLLLPEGLLVLGVEALGLLPEGAALLLGLLLGAVPLVGLLALGVLAEGSEVTGLFSANTGSVLAGRS